MDDEEFLMISWKRQMPRGTKWCQKNRNYVIRKHWKNLRVKNSERKTMSESEANERETFTHR
jgi:hypothetical protein